MSFPAYLPAHAYGLSGVDSLLFLDPGVPDSAPPEHARVDDDTFGTAAAHGLAAAGDAAPDDIGPPDDGPGLPDLPDRPEPLQDRGFPEFTHYAEVEVLEAWAFGKGGTPSGGGGKPDKSTGGDPSGGTTDPVLSEYISGQNADGKGFSDYNIDIAFKGSWTAPLQKAFFDASELISDIITGDIADVFFRGKVIDDIRIEAKLSSIDGPGGILGQAGPTAYRTSDFLPASAVMEFDIADAENYDTDGLFNDIVFHEMMHCVGFGTMWDMMGLVSDASSDGSDLRFTGGNAKDEYAAEFDTSGDAAAGIGVPVESDFGAGTRGGHWNDGEFEPDGSPDDQPGFGNEIMTGFINGTNYLSNITIAALQDMRYETVYEPNADLVNDYHLDLSIFSDSVAMA